MQTKGNGSGGGVSNGNSTDNMRNKHYPNRTIRLPDDFWKWLKKVRKRSGLSWHLFLRQKLSNKPDKSDSLETKRELTVYKVDTFGAKKDLELDTLDKIRPKRDED